MVLRVQEKAEGSYNNSWGARLVGLGVPARMLLGKGFTLAAQVTLRVQVFKDEVSAQHHNYDS